MNHPLFNSIGVLIVAAGLIIGAFVQLGQRDAEISANKVAIQDNKTEIKEGFAALTKEIQKLRESEANEDIAVLKVRIENQDKVIEQIMEELKEHDHNGIYVRKEDYRANTSGTASQ